MCDTLWWGRGSLVAGVVGAGGTVASGPVSWFAKASDRPPGELQLFHAQQARSAGGRLCTTYMEIEDAGALPGLWSGPAWMWGAEQGVNVHGVAIGNEKVYTAVDPYGMPPALTGMDLVRLGLERGSTAQGALEVITSLIERYGQGGVCDLETKEPYFSSFIVADPKESWVLETAGRTWVARRFDDGSAISNRLALHDDWDLSSADVPPGADFDGWRNHEAPTGYADVRLASSRAFLSETGLRAARAAEPKLGRLAPVAALVGHLRDHGSGPWGVPGARHYGSAPQDVPGEKDQHVVVAPPEFALPDGTGVTVCMHVRCFQATTAAMVAELRSVADGGSVAWLALGSPCTSVFVPVWLGERIDASEGPILPSLLADKTVWHDLVALREAVEADGSKLALVRAVLDPVEDELFEMALGAGGEQRRWSIVAHEADRMVRAALASSLDATEASG